MKGVFKTEAALGAKEYSPITTIPMAQSDSEIGWEETFRTRLIEQLKSYDVIRVKKLFPEFVEFNNDLQNPKWFWSEQQLKTAGIWRLNDINTLLSNANNTGKLIQQTS